MYTSTQAIVLREVKYKEADKILSLFSRNKGIITAKAPSALRKNSKLGAASQQLTYSDFVLFERQGKYTVREASIIEAFTGLQKDLAAFALGCYFADCIEALCEENSPDEPILQLLLNCLYALSKGLCPQEQIKASFELCLMSALGYLPELNACAACGSSQPEKPVLLHGEGCIACSSCVQTAHDYSPVSMAALCAMRYVVSAEPKKLLSYKIDDEALFFLSNAAEKYLLYHSSRKFSTLDYWKRIKTL